MHHEAAVLFQSRYCHAPVSSARPTRIMTGFVTNALAPGIQPEVQGQERTALTAEAARSFGVFHSAISRPITREIGATSPTHLRTEAEHIIRFSTSAQ